jgi:hypothetical protein
MESAQNSTVLNGILQLKKKMEIRWLAKGLLACESVVLHGDT